MLRDLPEDLATSMSSTLQHITLIQQKEAKLAAARHDALAQVLHRIGSDYNTGQLTLAQLCTAFEETRQLNMTGSATTWNELIGIRWQRMIQLSKQLPNGPEGNWVGEYPFHPETVAPIHGVAVVYVLFDETNEPCYVGSSNNFRQRLKAHAKDGKHFARWHAHPCRDREHAYQVEDRLLKEHKPRLNRKASR
jgi:predicted GIY-YIG superfamily endonuclease